MMCNNDEEGIIMTEKEFLDMMDEILDAGEPIKLEAVLDEIEEWDSLSVIMFQSESFKRTKRPVSPSDARKAKTIGDLYALVKE